MPIYEYICPKCKSKFEMLRSMSEANDEAPCPACKTPANRALSKFACFTKGNGGNSSPVGGGCSGCGSSNCGSCGH